MYSPATDISGNARLKFLFPLHEKSTNYKQTNRCLQAGLNYCEWQGFLMYTDWIHTWTVPRHQRSKLLLHTLQRVIMPHQVQLIYRMAV